MPNAKVLKQLCELIIDCEHKTAPTGPRGYPSIRTPNIGRGRLILDGVNRVSEETYQAWTRRGIPQGGDLILAREAPVGNVAIIPMNLKVCLGQRTVLIRPKKDLIDPDYLLYLVLSDEIQGKIRSMANGATVGHLNMRDIRALELPGLPKLKTQQRIGGLLATYDDLIENNRRRLTILEEMARLIYDEWFVKFQFPGHGKARITDSDGLIGPREWERTSVAQACVSVDDGDWIETKDQGGNGYRLLQISNVGVNSFVETDNFRFITEETFRRLRCKEVLPDHILVARMPTPIGRAWLVTPQPWKMITAVDVAILEADRSRAHVIFLLHFLNSEQTLAAFAGKASGTTRPRITRRQIASTPILLPPLELQARFAKVVAPINELVAALYRANLNLRSTRDLLLPRLISGEIHVENLDIPTEAATVDAAAASP